MIAKYVLDLRMVCKKRYSTFKFVVNPFNVSIFLKLLHIVKISFNIKYEIYYNIQLFEKKQKTIEVPQLQTHIKFTLESKRYRWDS